MQIRIILLAILFTLASLAPVSATGHLPALLQQSLPLLEVEEATPPDPQLEPPEKGGLEADPKVPSVLDPDPKIFDK